MIDGVFVVDKPAGITSHDVVARLRRVLKQKRIGHSGTLDPNATGLLLVAVGRATRLLKFTSEHPKSYSCNVVLGATTTTLDADGEVSETFDMSAVTIGQVKDVAGKFVGDIEQIPPMVSAVKVDGKRLHQLAREGVEVERKPRPVTIHSISISGEDVDALQLDVSCSSGTYVRTLVADIGTALGGGAHLKNLVRTAIGPFAVSQSSALESIEGDWTSHIRPIEDLLAHMDGIEVDEDGARAVSHGKSLNIEASGSGPWKVLDGRGRLLGVYCLKDESLVPDVVVRVDSET